MTFEESEASVHNAKPIELFKFEGTYANFYYTSGPKKIEFQADDELAPNEYLPIAIKRSKIRAGTQADDGLDITIDVPASSEVAQTYGFSETPPSLNLIIYRYHREETDFRRYWTGTIENIQTNDGVSTMRSPSTLGSALVGQVPNVYYQSPCNHVLFDTRCRVLEEDWTITTEVDGVNGKIIAVAALDNGIELEIDPETELPIDNGRIDLDGQLVGGEICLSSGERRMIVEQDEFFITVNFPFFALIAGTEVTITAGCDHRYLGDCKTRFKNQKRYGGTPYIDGDNVFSNGLEPGKPIPDNTCVPPVFEGWDFEILMVTDFCCWATTERDLYPIIAAGGNFTSVPGFRGVTGPLQWTNYARFRGPDDRSGNGGIGNWGASCGGNFINPAGFGPAALDNRAHAKVYLRHWAGGSTLIWEEANMSGYGNRIGMPTFYNTLDWRDYR